MDGQQIPSQVWDWALKWIPPGFMCIGALVVAVWWKKGRFPIVGGDMKGRRIDDKLLDRLLDIQEANTKAVNNLADVLREQSIAIAAEMRNQSNIVSNALITGLREVHERFDAYISTRTRHRDPSRQEG